MKQNRTVEYLRGRWSALVKTLSNMNRRNSIAAASSAAAILLILGGIVFASENGTPRKVAAPFQTANSNKSNSQTVPTSVPAQEPGSTPSSETPTSLPTPTTIIGPNGETIVVPPLTTKPTQPITGTTVPPTSPSTPGTVTTPSTVPASAPPTTAPPRPTPTNGPSLPSVDTSVSSSTEDPNASLTINATDSDGFISMIDINWGDGTSEQISYSLSTCVDPPNTSHNETRSHVYTDAGTHDATVSVTSVACSGDSSTGQTGFAYPVITTGGTSSPPVTTSGEGQ